MKLHSIVAVIVLLAFPCSLSAQTEISVGKTKINLQSPIKFTEKTPEDSAGMSGDSLSGRKLKSFPSMSISLGGVASDIQYKTAFPRPSTDYTLESELGFKQIFMPAPWYGFGFGGHISAQTYRLQGVAATGIIKEYPENADIYKEFINYYNVGIDIFNRFHLYKDMLYIDLRLYGDWAFSREFYVKYAMNGSPTSTVDRFRDGTRFLPFQAGVEASLGIGSFQFYFRYRFTDMFNHDLIPLEPERFSVGIRLELR